MSLGSDSRVPRVQAPNRPKPSSSESSSFHVCGATTGECRGLVARRACANRSRGNDDRASPVWVLSDPRASDAKSHIVSGPSLVGRPSVPRHDAQPNRRCTSTWSVGCTHFEEIIANPAAGGCPTLLFPIPPTNGRFARSAGHSSGFSPRLQELPDLP